MVPVVYYSIGDANTVCRCAGDTVLALLGGFVEQPAAVFLGQAAVRSRGPATRGVQVRPVQDDACAGLDGVHV